MFNGIGKFVDGLITFATVSILLAWPLALWKLWDIGWWLWNNVSVGVK